MASLPHRSVSELDLEQPAPSWNPAELAQRLAEFRGENNRLSPETRIPARPVVSPFEHLAARYGRPLKVAILSDFTRIPYANGAAFQTRFLYQELQRCGHAVTIIGPEDPEAQPHELAPGTVALPSVPMRMYPGVHLPLPLTRDVFDPDRWDFDLVFGQTTTLLLEFGIWLRKMRGIPFLCVNTTHLASAYEVLLPDSISRVQAVHAGLDWALRRPYQNLFKRIYNESDGLVVLSEGLRAYWRQCGVEVPIHVIPRAVQPEVFDRQQTDDDPYESFLGPLAHGPRLLSAGRHTREKCQDRTIRIFARHIAPELENATLTVVGQGPETAAFRKVAEQEGVADRVFFVGEVPFSTMASYYGHADVFMHTSLSETYGNVLGEALWCATPTVAFADGMGASAQVRDGHNGVLLAPGKGGGDEASADEAFGRAVVALIHDPEERARLGRAAGKRARENSSPLAVQAKLAAAFESAEEHARRSDLRRRAEGTPRVVRWLQTARHFQSWSTSALGLSLLGALRKPYAKDDTPQPQIHQKIDT